MKATLNILIPSSIAATVTEDDILQKICCVGEFRTDDGNPTIQKSLTGQELSEFVINTDMKRAQMYWGRIVRRLEPVISQNGILLKVQIEFNSEGALWRYSSYSEDQYVKPSSRMCFSVTLLILHISSKQSVLSISNPVLLKNMLQNEIFFPIAYFDSPCFGTHPNNDDIMSENELKVDGDNITQSKYSEEDSSVLDRVLSSAPYLQSRDDFLLATWLQSVHHSISSVVSESSLTGGGLGFRYEIPTVYRDTTKTFLPLFLQLLPPRHFDTPLPENENLLSDKKDLSTEDKAKILYDMRRDATVGCLTGKMRVPIVTETAAMYVMTEIAKEKIAKKKCANLGNSSFSVSKDNQDLPSESSCDNTSDAKHAVENEQESSEKDCQSFPSQLVHLRNELSEVPESAKEDKPSTAIDFLSMIAQYYVHQNDVSSKIDPVKEDIIPNNTQTIGNVQEDDEFPSPKRIKLTLD